MDNYKEPSAFIRYLPNFVNTLRSSNVISRGEQNHPITYWEDSLFSKGAKTYLHCFKQSQTYQSLGWCRQKWHAIQFICLVEQHFAKEPSPVFYASCLNLSEQYLREICKKELKYPPVFWINLRRIAASLSLLSNGSLLVKEIADETGFEDVSYFIRVFKKYIGLPPNAFRDALLI